MVDFVLSCAVIEFTIADAAFAPVQVHHALFGHGVEKVIVHVVCAVVPPRMFPYSFVDPAATAGEPPVMHPVKTGGGEFKMYHCESTAALAPRPAKRRARPPKREARNLFMIKPP
jgi:hypothetical protein